MKFYNPYQFIPVTGKVNGKATSAQVYSDIEKGKIDYIRHDRWDDNSYSGRLLCQLKTLSPLVVGAKQDKGSSAKAGVVHPYTNAHGLAIPGNSLRGMFASIAETISQSSLRVLADKQKARYSVRKQLRSPLQLIGIIQQNANKEWGVLPLASVGLIDSKLDKGKQLFGNKFLHYRARYINSDTLDSLIQSYQQNDNHELHNAAYQQDQRYVEKLDSEGCNNSGILYINGGNGVKEQMPKKKYELFIPIDKSSFQRTPLPLSNDLLKDFEQMLRDSNKTIREDEKGKSLPPYLPTGYDRDCESDNPILKPGDLLYFDINDNKEVCELSFSAIWRKRKTGDLHEAFEHAGKNKAGKNVLPWSSSSKREELTPAECLFGVVENIDEKIDRPGRNLASRVRFFDAIAEDGLDLKQTEVLLKILASPKPPSPAMYFSAAADTYISKDVLNLSKHVPNGRKRYLPQPEAVNSNKKPWLTNQPEEHLKQKLKCTPIPENKNFYFHIDFENLAAQELQLLIASITPQTALKTEAKLVTFQHQLGLGKPFGLGQIEVEHIATFLIDRKKRYSKDQLFALRYHQWSGKESSAWDTKLQKIYAEEYAFAKHPDPIIQNQLTNSNDLIDSDTLQLLLTLGNPDNIIEPVCYPFSTQTKKQGDVIQKVANEGNGYQWFVQNDEGDNHQHLKKVEINTPLPTLKSCHSTNDNT